MNGLVDAIGDGRATLVEIPIELDSRAEVIGDQDVGSEES
jgi:hypothetical protein